MTTATVPRSEVKNWTSRNHLGELREQILGRKRPKEQTEEAEQEDEDMPRFCRCKREAVQPKPKREIKLFWQGAILFGKIIAATLVVYILMVGVMCL